MNNNNNKDNVEMKLIGSAPDVDISDEAVDNGEVKTEAIVLVSQQGKHHDNVENDGKEIKGDWKLQVKDCGNDISGIVGVGCGCLWRVVN